jgi:hypothetical protein
VKGENTFVDMIDRALQEEFVEAEQTGADTNLGTLLDGSKTSEGIFIGASPQPGDHTLLGNRSASFCFLSHLLKERSATRSEYQPLNEHAKLSMPRNAT